jgi:pilus assembly protein Flp/PilA
MFAFISRIDWAVAGRRRRPHVQRGQGLVEYGLILLIVAVAVVITLTALGGQLKTVFDTVKNTFPAT